MEPIVTIYLFILISDVLINLLIRDLWIKDGITKATDVSCDSLLNHMRIFSMMYVCKIRFKWNINRDSKEITYRDLAGPEKVRLHKSINIPVLFPALNKKE